ncbi:MAG TPA: glycosyltransferase family 4 protein [Solirubrobacteraceae bacterium]
MSTASSRQRVAMLLENNPYPQDIRVRREAEALVRAGHAVSVIAPRDPGQPRRETIAGVRVRRFRAPAGGTGARSIALEYAVAGARLHVAALVALARGATVLHLHNPPDLLAGAGLLARLLRRSVVFDHHDLFPELVAEKSPGRALGLVARLAERSTFAVANLVLSTNESMAEIARTRGRVRAERVAVVRNGPPAAWIARARPGRQGTLDDPRLVYVGAISSQDGVRDVAELLRLLVEVHGLAGTRLTIVGAGDARPDVERELRRAGVQARVDWAGWVGVEQIPALLAAADVCIDPAPASALNHRSTMIKIAEYLTAGRPVVAYDLVETRRTLAGAGVVVAAGDVAAMAVAVAHVARDGDERAALGIRATARAAELTWEHSERALLAAYERLSYP